MMNVDAPAPPLNPQLFAVGEAIAVRAVELRRADPPQTHREKLARILLDEMFQFVGLLDAQGTLIDVNRNALEGAGIELDRTLGLPFWEARWWQVSRETQEGVKDSIRRASAGEFVRYDVEIYGQGAGEDTIIIDYSLVPIRDRAGQVVMLLAEGRDITEKKRAEAEIARKNQELERLLSRLRELDEIKTSSSRM
jgi:PAS domain S-box-containing protein